MRRSLYVITFQNGKRYVGISFNPQKRWREHNRRARSGEESPLYRAMRKYPEALFTVLVIGEDQYIRDLEVTLIAAWQTTSHEFGYNVAKGGDLGTTGLTASEATRKKMSVAHKGRKQSSEWVAKRTSTQIGKRRSEESRVRMSAGQKKRIRTDVELARMKEIARKAAMVRQSAEYRLKASAAAKRRWARERQSPS